LNGGFNLLAKSLTLSMVLAVLFIRSPSRSSQASETPRKLMSLSAKTFQWSLGCCPANAGSYWDRPAALHNIQTLSRFTEAAPNSGVFDLLALRRPAYSATSAGVVTINGGSRW